MEKLQEESLSVASKNQRLTMEVEHLTVKNEEVKTVVDLNI
jgi:hypothetical protein